VTGTGGTSGSGGTPTAGTGGGDASVNDAIADDATVSRPDVFIPPAACTTCKLKVKYRAGDTNPADNQIKPQLNVMNVGSTGVPLAELAIRYWYTIDGDRPQSYACDYAAIGCSNVTWKFVDLGAAAEQGANHYLELGFTAAAGTLSAGGQSGEIQSRIQKDDYSTYDEVDDYSFDPAKIAFTDWTRVTLHHNGGLVWGVDPACASPGDGSSCASDAALDGPGDGSLEAGEDDAGDGRVDLGDGHPAADRSAD
jgi:hypothetical protein